MRSLWPQMAGGNERFPQSGSPTGRSIPVNKWTLDKLKSLLEDAVAESRSIEYKSILPNDSEDSKREFLNDVTSFANSLGGTLIFGIEEDQGVPINITGIDISDLDAAIRRLDQILLNSVEPRLQGVHFEPVRLPSGRYVLALDVFQSVGAPHMVVKTSRFFTRGQQENIPWMFMSSGHPSLHRRIFPLKSRLSGPNASLSSGLVRPQFRWPIPPFSYSLAVGILLQSKFGN